MTCVLLIPAFQAKDMAEWVSQALATTRADDIELPLDPLPPPYVAPGVSPTALLDGGLHISKVFFFVLQTGLVVRWSEIEFHKTSSLSSPFHFFRRT